MLSQLSIVLDLRLLGRVWHGTRDGPTPQPVRRTLGNEGAFHPHHPRPAAAAAAAALSAHLFFGFPCCGLVCVPVQIQLSVELTAVLTHITDLRRGPLSCQPD